MTNTRRVQQIYIEYVLCCYYFAFPNGTCSALRSVHHATNPPTWCTHPMPFSINFFTFLRLYSREITTTVPFSKYPIVRSRMFNSRGTVFVCSRHIMLLVVLQSHTNLLSFFNLGGQEETRTLSLRLLRPLRLPISPQAHY